MTTGEWSQQELTHLSSPPRLPSSGDRWVVRWRQETGGKVSVCGVTVQFMTDRSLCPGPGHKPAPVVMALMSHEATGINKSH